MGGDASGWSAQGETLATLWKKAWFAPAYDFASGLRTSNMVDRVMQGLDKYLFAGQYLHGTVSSAHASVRNDCLLTNFRPYNPTAVKALAGHRSPFERVNGWTSHENRLQNLLITTSRQEIYRYQHKLSE